MEYIEPIVFEIPYVRNITELVIAVSFWSNLDETLQ